jgi:diguanylate cyclase (GGDEF)-like protein
MDRLDRALARSDRHHDTVAVLFLDLDNFKVVNDSLGHQIGDQLLKEIGGRLLECVRPDDTVARLGGDEFTIVLEQVEGSSTAVEVAECIARRLQEPLVLGGHEVVTSASIGIALSRGQDRPDSLLRDADLAMYRAKAGGKAAYAIFDHTMNARAMQRLELESELRHAVERGELRVYYQPIMELTTGRLGEVEALVRWEHPRRGLVSPADFIPIAEETGLILPLGRWVLAEACRQVRAWQSEQPAEAPIILGVNLSARQFQSPDLVADIATVLDETGLPASSLKLEITESVMMSDAETTSSTLRRLKQLGVGLAVDDFGTGYSSLAYLQHFPIDVLKIDRSFVDRLGHDQEADAIVRAIITLARTLNMSVTGEGIETSQQMARLRALGCDLGQGYLIARPGDGETTWPRIAESIAEPAPVA